MKFYSQKPNSLFSSSFSSIIVFMAILLVICFYENGVPVAVVVAAVTPPNNETVPAVFIFGDSVMDPGNNNYIKTIVKCNFPPYGRDFTGGKPTGRFSNGKIPSDAMAQGFGVKDLLPPYLDPHLKPEDLITGVSFASGGAGYDPLTAEIVSVLSLSDQLNLFKKSLTAIKATVGEEGTVNILSRSVFIVCSGSDDIANTYFSTPFRRAHYDINSYTDLTVRSASSFLLELYRLGARRIGVFSAPPIGCVPSQRTLGGGLQRGCSDSANEAAQIFNSKLESLLDSLNQKFTDSRFVYIDVYAPLLSLIQNPARYGFEVVNKGCCGTGKIEVSILCNRLEDAHTCSDASKYIFWDSYHPTEAAYNILSNEILGQITDKFF